MSGPGSPSGSPSGAAGAGAEQVFAQLLLQLQQGASADCQRDKRRSTEAGRRTPEIFNSTRDG